MESQFQQTVSRSLGALEAGVAGINARLDKLNGSVARHEAQIGELKMRDAVQDAKAATEKENNRTWREVLMPIAKVLLALLLGLLAGHKGPELLKALGQ